MASTDGKGWTAPHTQKHTASTVDILAEANRNTFDYYSTLSIRVGLLEETFHLWLQIASIVSRHFRSL